jgi:hypothetical protein
VGRQPVGWAHCQVGGSSGRTDPLVRDGRELGRWKPRGTHVSHHLLESKIQPCIQV